MIRAPAGQRHAVELGDVLRRAPAEARRRVVAQDLLERVAHELGLRADLRVLAGVLRERPDHAADAVDRRVRARGEERADEQLGLLLGDLAGVGRLEHLPAEAVGVDGVALHGAVHPGDRVRGALHAAPLDLVRGAERVERGVPEAQQVVAALLGEAEDVREDLQDVRGGDVEVAVDDPAALEQPVDERDGRAVEVLLHLAQRRRRERAHDHRAGAGVLGRVLGQQDRGADRLRVEERPVRRGEVLVVREDRVDVPEARDGPDVVALEVHRGGDVAQRAVVAMRVEDRLLGEGVVVGRRHIDRRCGHRRFSPS